jgi:SAM-dependent methyltransferase
MPDDKWPLFDVRLTLLPDSRVRLHLSLDFLIADAWSYFQVLLPDLVRFYQEPDAEVPPLRLTFRDYVVGTQRALESSDLYRRAQQYWRQRLATLPPAPRLPEAPPGRADGLLRFDRRRHRLEPATWDRLRSAANEVGVTPSGLLATTFAEVLRAWSGQRRFTINIPLFNRLPLHPEVNQLIGDTTTTLLLAVEKSDGTFTERAQALQQRLWTDLEHRYFNGVQVLRELTRLRGELAPAMPIVMTSLAGHPPRHVTAALGRTVYSISQTPQVSLDFQIFEVDGGLEFNWDFLPAVFADGLVEEMFDAYCTVLQRLATDPDAWLLPSFELTPTIAVPVAVEQYEPDEPAPDEPESYDAWERYWAAVARTGRGGDVLWDVDSDQEIEWCVRQAREHMDPSLPVVDVGCGNGRYSRALAEHFPAVVGVDVSASALAHAQEESRDCRRASYEVFDATVPGAAAALLDRIGPANVFVRAVLHVLDDAGRAAFAENMTRLLAGRGVLLLMEPDYREGAFGYLGFVGGRGRARALVSPLETAGVRHSTRFAGADLDRYFPPGRWDRIASGAVEMHAIDPTSDEAAVRLPGYFAVVRPEPSTVDEPGSGNRQLTRPA